MVFSSLFFLLLFLPITICAYYSIQSIRLKNGLLIVASLLFYTLGEPYYIFLLLFSSLLNYLFALLIQKDRKKVYLILCLVFNIGLLFLYKYLGFFVTIINSIGFSFQVPNLRMPIGISFFTFQILSYVLDVYMQKVEASKKFTHVLLYIAFFPQLIAGPIVKYHDISQQILHREHSLEKFALGMQEFSFGLAKKVLLSNTLAFVVDSIFQLPFHEINGMIAWIGAILYTLQIYYDFSGYSDMALGLGKMFGFTFNMNFNYPLSATSMKDFWRRWHISLSSWFKEYVYIPLGGNRISSKRTFVNKCVVFFLTGLWHGANYTFILWGMFNGILTYIEEKGTWVKKLQGNIFGWIYTMVCVIFSFTMFRSDTLQQALCFYKNMIMNVNFSFNEISLILHHFTPYVLFIIIVSCIGIFNHKIIRDKCRNWSLLVSAIYLIICLMSLATNGYNPFIYFRF